MNATKKSFRPFQAVFGFIIFSVCTCVETPDAAAQNYRDNHSQKTEFRLLASSPREVSGAADLLNDDGNNSPDDFFGLSDGRPMSWANFFTPSNDFCLEFIRFYLRTELLSFDPNIELSVRDTNGEIVKGFLTLPRARTGSWYEVELTFPVRFRRGETFAIQLEGLEGVGFPAGVDIDARFPNLSIYAGPGFPQFLNLNTVRGLENGAFLIRASGLCTNVESVNEVPNAFHLDQNYPNPFNPETTIRYALPNQAKVQLTIYDLSGRVVKELVSEKQSAGEHLVRWDGRGDSGHSVASGVYVYRLVVTPSSGAPVTLTRKLAFMK